MFKVTKKAARPAGNQDKCFYCKRKVGEKHGDTCVLVRKKVTVRATITYQVVVPASWEKDDVEFHRNESSWCADNMISDLDKFLGETECLCRHTRHQYVDDATFPYLDEG